jgi:hypothetical protein
MKPTLQQDHLLYILPRPNSILWKWEKFLFKLALTGLIYQMGLCALVGLLYTEHTNALASFIYI